MPAAYTYLQHNTKLISYAVFQFFLSEKKKIEKNMEDDGRKEGKENKKDSIICRSSITGTVFNGVRQFWALLMFKVFWCVTQRYGSAYIFISNPNKQTNKLKVRRRHRQTSGEMEP